MLSRKVLSLTKPKGKIYKTKSISHYITFGRQIIFFKSAICCLKERRRYFGKFELRIQNKLKSENLFLKSSEETFSRNYFLSNSPVYLLKNSMKLNEKAKKKTDFENLKVRFFLIFFFLPFRFSASNYRTCRHMI